MSDRRCPSCKTLYAGAVPAGGMLTCGSCGVRWSMTASSDEYMPGEERPQESVAKPLTTRHQPATDGGGLEGSSLPFDQLEDESSDRGKRNQKHISELAFRPSTEVGDGRYHCPVCGHGFAGDPAKDEQACPQCATTFSRSTGRLTAGGGGAGGDRLIGRVLRGCMIDRKLGEGGMGAVYHARQLSLDRSVAIKVLPPELARNRNFIQRFEREAKSLARINHPNILQIYDFGEEQAIGVYFMVIEFVDGWDLGELLRRQPTLTQIETLDIVRQALLGLEQAADKGVIHRDIKPDNLMMATSGLCKVSDFGLAKGQRSESEVTSIGVRVGTPAFMSPEQCDGVEVDSRSDVYNLGCTAYLMLTGRLPFDGETPFSIMLKHKVDPVPALRTHRPSLDPRLDALVQRMLAKKPDDRCQDLRELIDVAERLLVEMSGTSSVLRKTNGPIRALVTGTKTGQRSNDERIEVELPPDAVDASGSRPPLPGAKPSGRQKTVEPAKASSRLRSAAPAPAPAAAIPEWLRPVEESTAAREPTPSTDPPKSAAPVGSKTQPAQAIGSRTASAPALPANPTPPPGRRNPSSTILTPALDRARDRGLKAEVAAISTSAERMASAGNWTQAAAEWKRASHLVRDQGESARLATLAKQAAARAAKRRRLRTLFIVGGALLLLGVNAYIWPPVVHNILAEQERTRIDAIPDISERSARLRAFANANQGGWNWYRVLFQRGYEVPATTQALQTIDFLRQPKPVPPPRTGTDRPLAPRAGLGDAERLAADSSASWQQVADAARPAANAGDTRGKELLADAERRLRAAADLRTQLDSARSGGRHGAALDLAVRLRADHARSGASLDGLPLPGRVHAIDADTCSAVSELRLTADGITIQEDDGRFCRQARADTALEVGAPGYSTQRIAVTASAEASERVVEVRLLPAPLWRIAAPAQRPAWVRLLPAGKSGLLGLLPDAAAIIAPEDGERRSLTLPGTQLSPFSTGSGLFSTRDGEVRQLRANLERADKVRNLPVPPLALIDAALVYRAGVRATATVEESGNGRQIVLREGSRELWRRGGIEGGGDPLLRQVDDKFAVIDDGSVHLFEEDGAPASRTPLKATRIGQVAEVAGGRLLVPTAAGVEVLQIGTGTIRSVEIAWLATAGTAQIAAANDQVLLARFDGQVELAQWSADPKARWRARLAGRPAWCSLTTTAAAVAGETGTITVYRTSDGSVLRRVVHSASLACPPVLLPGLLVVADVGGGFAAYRLNDK